MTQILFTLRVLVRSRTNLLRPVIGLLSALVSLPAAEPSVATDVVELPPFVIADTKLSPPWRYAEMPGFEILSQCDDDETQAVADALYRGRILSLPPSLRPELAVPTSIIVFNQKSEAVTGLSPLGSVRGAEEQTSHWTGLIKRAAPDHEIFCINLWDRNFRYSSTFRFDMRTLLALRRPTVPAWLQEALHGRYGVFREGIIYPLRRSNRVGVVPGLWFSAPETVTAEAFLPKAQKRAQLLAKDPKTADRNASPLASLLLPLGQLFVLSSVDSPERLRRSAELGLFARWGLFAEEGRHADAFWSFATRACTEPVTEALLKECFGLSHAELLVELSWYLPVALGEIAERGIAPIKPPKIKLRLATRAEIARVRGEWERTEAGLLAARFPEIAKIYREQAGRTLRRAYDEGSRDPRVLAALGLYENETGNPVRARELLESATAAGVVRPLAYFELAVLRFAEAATAAGAEGRLDAARTAAVLSPLRTARQQPPAMIAAGELFAVICARSAVAPTPADIAGLVDGARLFPRNSGLAVRTAQALAQHGAAAAARAVIGHARKFAEDDEARAALLAVEETLVAP